MQDKEHYYITFNLYLTLKFTAKNIRLKQAVL